jgi:exopolysaccharide production protein ExoQ
MVKRALLRAFEQVYLVVGLLYFDGGFLTSHIAEGDVSQRQNSDLPKILLQLGLFGVLALLVAVHWRRVLAGVRSAGWVLALYALALSSAAWSSDIVFTFRRGLIFFVMTVFAIYIGSRFDWDEALDILGWTSAVVILASLFAVIFFPDYGISQDKHMGDWIGLFVHKNILGLQMIVAILTLAAGKPASLPAFVRGVLLCCGGMLLVFSHSAASWIAMAFVISLYPLLHLLRLNRRSAVLLGVAVLPVVVVATSFLALNYVSILGSLGRNATFTGRVPLWAAVMDSIRIKPWLGYGYAAFWRGVGGDSQSVITKVRWLAPHAHNGYLDLWLDLGLIGLSVFACGLVAAFRRAIYVFRTSSSRAERWPLAFLALFVLYNCAESHLLRLLSTLWIPYVATYVGLGAMLAQAHAEESETRSPEAPNGELIAVAGPALYENS